MEKALTDIQWWLYFGKDDQRPPQRTFDDPWTEALAQDLAKFTLRRLRAAPPSVPDPEPFDNTTEACRHCPTPEVHPTRIGGILTYEGRCDPDTCERHDHSVVAPDPEGLPSVVEELARWWVDSHRSSRAGFEAMTNLAAFWEDWWDSNMDEPWPLPRVARLQLEPTDKGERA